MSASPASDMLIAQPAAARPGINWLDRAIAGVLFFMCVGLLGVAASLEPDASGMGSHTQLGMAPCGFLVKTRMPCATCGMSTAYAHAADGDLIASFVTQPAGAVFALLTAMVAIVSGYAMMTGLSLLPVFAAVWRPRSVLLLGLLVVAAWGYKIFMTQGA